VHRSRDAATTAWVHGQHKQQLTFNIAKSTRGDILIYLLAHLVLSTREESSTRGPASTPWTEYLKFLPRHVPVPTMWSEVERALLQGTSLEVSIITDTRPHPGVIVAEPHLFPAGCGGG
jgi:hypothetical protein